MNQPVFRSILPALIAAALTACGGGGSDTAPPTPPSPAGFSFTLDTSKAIVWQGEQATRSVTVQRDAGFTAAIQFSVDGLPIGATAGILSVPAGSNTGTLTLQVTSTAPHSLPTTVTVKGVAGNVNASQPLTVTVRGQAGDVDTSYGGGTLVTPGGTTDDYVRGVAVQADGKAVVAGFGNLNASTGTDFMLLRHLRDGGLDPSFGSGGRVSTAFGPGADKVYALLLQPDGKIVLAGDSSQGANGSDFALARYNADGSLDASFGNGGKVLTAVGSDGARETVYGLALQTVGGAARIVAVGGEGDFIAAGCRADGTLDASFGTGGIVRSLFGSVTGAARGVVVTPANQLVLVGHRDHDFAAVRLLPNGSLDPAFGNAGRVIVAVSLDNWDEATALVRQTDGRLLLGGWVYTGNSSSADTVLVRLNADGSRDTAFSPNAIRITAVAAGTKTDAGRALALQPDERVPTVRVLQAGEANGSDLDVVPMRHWL